MERMTDIWDISGLNWAVGGGPPMVVCHRERKAKAKVITAYLLKMKSGRAGPKTTEGKVMGVGKA